MKFTTKQYAQCLVEVLETTSPNHQDKVIDNFISILRQNGDLTAYEKIISEVEIMFEKHHSTSQATITTATGASISTNLLRELNRFGKKHVNVQERTDKEIIGGVVIRVDDTLIDASLKTQLDNMKNNLVK